MKIYSQLLALGLLASLTLAGCDLFQVDDRADPNGPSVDDILANPTRDALINLASGIEASARIDHNLYMVDAGVIGREFWRTSAADPRLTGDLLGRGTSILDNNTFYITRPWGARYVTIRNANIMLQALELNETLSDAEKASGRGYAKTIKAYQYLLNLNLTFENGIRFIEPGDEGPGPVVGYSASLGRIADLLAEAAADLSTAGGSFFFPLSGGFTGFDSPGTFRQVNRAMAARVALYAGNNTGALTDLSDSFLDPAGSLQRGADHVFSTGAGDITNPLFLPPDNPAGDAFLAHPSFMADLEAGDSRADKVFDRGEPSTFDDLTSSFGFFVYKNSLDPVTIIRNGELVLIRAEARARTSDLPGAISDIDIVRGAAGLAPYAGAVEQGAVLAEVLRQRRYELYGEGHRWIDVRRFGLLNSLPIDRPGDDVWDRFPIPLNENV